MPSTTKLKLVLHIVALATLELIYHNHVVLWLLCIPLPHLSFPLARAAHGKYDPSQDDRHERDDQQDCPRRKRLRGFVVCVMSIVLDKAAVV